MSVLRLCLVSRLSTLLYSAYFSTLHIHNRGIKYKSYSNRITGIIRSLWQVIRNN
ncbi:hypothetical protein HMPREF1575_00537 [Gardnerella vaginalis JCP7672]|nr:hypothetical protein HMPREF1575_00537 [Gardnerella vaginalis JCP7672]